MFVTETTQRIPQKCSRQDEKWTSASPCPAVTLIGYGLAPMLGAPAAGCMLDGNTLPLPARGGVTVMLTAEATAGHAVCTVPSVWLGGRVTLHCSLIVFPYTLAASSSLALHKYPHGSRPGRRMHRVCTAASWRKAGEEEAASGYTGTLRASSQVELERE